MKPLQSALLALALSSLTAACQSPPQEAPNDKPRLAAQPGEIAFKNEKGQLVCPVMGDVIESPAEALAREEYNGKVYYFCCLSCVKAFKKEPEKYADGKFLAAKAAPSASR